MANSRGTALTSAVGQKVSASNGNVMAARSRRVSTSTSRRFVQHHHGGVRVARTGGFCHNRGLHGSDLLAVGIHHYDQGCGHCLQGFTGSVKGCTRGMPAGAASGLRDRLCHRAATTGRVAPGAATGASARCCHRCATGAGAWPLFGSDRCRALPRARCKVAATWGFVL